MFFEIYLLCSTNRKFQKKLLIDCDCYKMYNTKEAFMENIIVNRKSYMACLGYRSNTRNRSGHRSVPIFLGSYLDYRIRGKEAVEESRGQWGLVILRGVLKMYSSFSTFGKYYYTSIDYNILLSPSIIFMSFHFFILQMPYRNMSVKQKIPKLLIGLHI